MEQEIIEQFLQTKSVYEFQELKMQLGFAKLPYTELPSIIIQHLREIPSYEGYYEDPDIDEEPPEFLPLMFVRSLDELPEGMYIID